MAVLKNVTDNHNRNRSQLAPADLCWYCVTRHRASKRNLPQVTVSGPSCTHTSLLGYMSRCTDNAEA